MTNVFKFTQRCLKCGGVQQILKEQNPKKPLQKPEKYECEQCGHKGVYGEQAVAPQPIIQTMPDGQLPPVFDENNEPCLVVGGKRLPFTKGRIELLKKEIAGKMAQLNSLENTWKLESEKK